VLTRISRRLHFPSFVRNEFPFFSVINSNSQGVFIVHKHSGSVQSRRRFHLGRLQSGSFVLVVINLCTRRRTWKRNKLIYNPYKIPKRPAMLTLWSTKWRYWTEVTMIKDTSKLWSVLLTCRVFKNQEYQELTNRRRTLLWLQASGNHVNNQG